MSLTCVGFCIVNLSHFSCLVHGDENRVDTMTRIELIELILVKNELNVN